MKPLLVGYQAIRVDASPDALENGRRLLAAFASREGYAMGEVFVERDVNRPLSAFAELIESVRRGSWAAVAVPSLDDLGRLPRVQLLMRDRLEREGGVRVLVAQPFNGIDPPAEATDRFAMEVVTSSGRAAEVGFRVRMDTVEVWHHEHCAAVLDRDVLRDWLNRPGDPLQVDEVTFDVERRGMVAITLPGLTTWTFSPLALAGLRTRL